MNKPFFSSFGMPGIINATGQRCILIGMFAQTEKHVYQITVCYLPDGKVFEVTDRVFNKN